MQVLLSLPISTEKKLKQFRETLNFLLSMSTIVIRTRIDYGLTLVYQEEKKGAYVFFCEELWDYIGEEGEIIEDLPDGIKAIRLSKEISFQETDMLRRQFETKGTWVCPEGVASEPERKVV